MLSSSTLVEKSQVDSAGQGDNCGLSRLRKSVSDPTELRPSKSKLALQELDRCFSLLSVLGKSIENSEQLVRNMPGNCKYCHGPTGTPHTGSKWGYDACKLPHSSLCLGSVTAIPDKRMACPSGYKPGMVMDFPSDPRNSTSEDDTDSVSDQHLSQLESETAFDDDDDQKSGECTAVDKLLAPLIDLTMKETSATPKSSSLLTTSSSTTTSVSWAAPGILPSVSTSSFWTTDSNLVHQQLAEMKKQQVLQMEKDRERDSQLEFLRCQLVEANKVALEARSEASVRRKTSRNVSFSTGPSSGGELADQAAKLSARAQRKAKKKANDVGVDMSQIRSTPGIGDKVDQLMESVNGIPSLSLGHNLPATATSGHSLLTSDSSIPQPSLSDGAGAGTDSSIIATLMAQQQSMMTNQMKMFMDF